MTVDSIVTNRVCSIDTDFACAVCGYNLRGLSRESACPECGTSIERSLAAMPMLAWRRRFRIGVFALAVALLVMKFAEWLLLIYFRFVFLRLHVNTKGAMMVCQAAALLPAALWLTRSPPPGWSEPVGRKRVIFYSVAILLVLGVANLLAYFNFSYVGQVVILSCYALGPIVLAVCIVAILGPVVNATGVIPNSLPRIVVQAVRWLLGYALLGSALPGAVIYFARIKFIRLPMPPSGLGINPKLERWMEVWLWVPSDRLAGPLWLATLLVLAHTFYRLHGPLIAPSDKERVPGR